MDPSADAVQAQTPEIMARLLESRREFLRFLSAKLGDAALAEDILQDAFVRGLAKMSELRDGDSARAWFYRLLRNAVIDHARRRGSAQRRLASYAAELAGHDDQSEAETADQVCKCVSRLAETLKPEYAEAVQRIEIQGMAVKDFAESAGISSSNAAVRIFRARKALHAQLLASCGACATHGCLNCSCSHHQDS